MAPTLLPSLLQRGQAAIDNLAMLARLTRDVPAFLRRPIPLAESVAWQRDRLAHREAWLLRIVQRQIYAVPHSPHARLLRAAGSAASTGSR